MEREKIRKMLREKKKEYRKKLYKENARKDLRGVVKWAKGQWRIREVMKAL